MKIAVTIPRQSFDRDGKVAWLKDAIARTDCDLFLLPQEYFGGLYGMPSQVHVERSWVQDVVGSIARSEKKHIGVGAACTMANRAAMEDYIYFDDEGIEVGFHSKFALPSYDDVRTHGGGQLWPETSFRRRVEPILLPKLGLKIGTIFCWEIFSLMIGPAYSFAGVNLIVHPIKFAPRGWLKLSKANEDPTGKRQILGFDQEKKSQIWIEKILATSKHITMCPIAITCNTWNLGEKYMAICGLADELRGRTSIVEVPSKDTESCIKVFDVNPKYYDAFDTSFNIGSFKETAGSLDDYHRLGEWTMHKKMRRLEAHLIGGTTSMSLQLLSCCEKRQSKSVGTRFSKKVKK